MRVAERIIVGVMAGLFLAIAGATAVGAIATDTTAVGTIAAGVTTGAAAEAGPAVEVTYLANEGFLIEIGSKKLLIDALFDDETIDYCHRHSAETLAKMEKAEAPFDDIDLVLVTHGHRDHFSAEPVMKHLAADPGSVFVGPPQAVKELGEIDLGGKKPGGKNPGEKKLKAKHRDRIEEVDLDLFASSEFEFDGIRIQAHRIHHSQYMDKDEETGEEINRHRDVENLAYLIEIGEVRLLHVGDAVLPLNREYLESERFPKGKIDIVFLEFFDWSEETKEILELMRPDHIIFMHLPPQPEEIEKYTGYLSGKFPNAVLFQEPLESRSF